MTTPHLPSAGPGDAPVDSPHGSAGASSSSLAAPALIDDAWDSQAKWWDLGTYGGLALFAVTLWGAGPQEASAWWLLTPPALIAAAWWLLGRRAAATGSPLLTWAYLLLAFAATVVSSTVSGMGPML
ncbi:MAG: hypothetical protein FWG11_04105, partial [Promicromonosporaceae bacterium]|nr:hypothetical protein [Promicromonosporaceae bacterium]